METTISVNIIFNVNNYFTSFIKLGTTCGRSFGLQLSCIILQYFNIKPVITQKIG